MEVDLDNIENAEVVDETLGASEAQQATGKQEPSKEETSFEESKF